MYGVYVATTLYSFGITGWTVFAILFPVICNGITIAFCTLCVCAPCAYICNREEIEEEIKREENGELEYQRSSEDYYKMNIGNLNLNVMDSPYPWGTIPYNKSRDLQNNPINYDMFVV